MLYVFWEKNILNTRWSHTFLHFQEMLTFFETLRKDVVSHVIIAGYYLRNTSCIFNWKIRLLGFYYWPEMEPIKTGGRQSQVWC